MSKSSSLARWALSCLCALGAAASAQAQTNFKFTFDNTPDDFIVFPTVGRGDFSFANDPGLGTYRLDSLGEFDLSLRIGARTFSERDITTPLDQVQVVITPYGSNRRLQFSNVLGQGTGGAGGSLDLFNAAGQSLSFEASGGSSGLRLYRLADSAAGRVLSGDYFAVQAAVPEPGAALMLGVGLLGVFGLAQRRRSAPRG